MKVETKFNLGDEVYAIEWCYWTEGSKACGECGHVKEKYHYEIKNYFIKGITFNASASHNIYGINFEESHSVKYHYSTASHKHEWSEENTFKTLEEAQAKLKELEGK